MIALLRGEVAVRRHDHVVIVCGGVGHRVAVSAETLHHIPAVGDETTLHTHLIVRDDALALYGFHSETERDLFLMLLAVQSVGPKVALAVLSGGPPRELLGRSPRATPRVFRPFPGSASARRSASSSSCARKSRSPTRPPRAARVRDRRAPGSGAAREGARARGTAGAGLHPGEAEELLRDIEGESAEELLAEALRTARGRVMTRIQTPYAIEEEEEVEFDRSLRPRRLDDFVGQDGLREQLRWRSRPRRARGGARPSAARRPSGPRQDLACADRRKRAGSAVRADRGARAGAKGRHCGVSHGPGAAQRFLRR